jgi:hypothetical protein
MTADSTSIQQQPDGRFRLDLHGTFPPEWTGCLCARLSARRIDVERGFARQVQRGQWESMFELRPLDDGIDPARIDYRALALAHKEPRAAGRANITSFTLEDRNDSIRVAIRAPDELGLLGRLLGAFSYLMLFVHDMQIETVGSEAQDVFVLKGLAGMAPGFELRERLRASLEAMTRSARAAA